MLSPAVPRDRSGTHVYATLDGLRGIAAALIAIRHAGPLFPGWVFPHSPLAVDLFFVISGFVIASAYDRRLENGLTPMGFMKLRLIRLYPLYLAGLLLGLCAGMVCWLTGTDPRLSAATLIGPFLVGLLILPSPFTWNNETFPLNPPAWSLFFELAINYVYAAAYRRVTKARLIGITCIFGSLLLIMSLNDMGLDEGHSWPYFSTGFVRVVFSFSAGLLLFRLRRRINISSFGSVLIIGLAGATLAMPNLGSWYSLVAITLWIPVLVFFATAVEPGPRVRRACLLLGQISYPLYVLHSPAAVIVESALARVGIVHPNAVIGVIFLGSMIVIALWTDRFIKALISDRFRGERRMHSSRPDIGGSPAVTTSNALQ
jgi:peptidoglycan/LPS O-acetylase OafA/YrhL